MSGLTVLTAFIVFAALSGRITYPQALAAGAITPAGAALVVGSTVVPTFYAVALVTAATLALGVLGFGRLSARQPLPPGGLLLICFLLWSTIVTLMAPLLFDGMRLVHPVSTQLHAGTLTSSNVAQVTYLVLGISIVFVLARSPAVDPGLLGIALGSALVLSFARYLSLQLGLPFPEGFFDNSPNFNYIETAAGGLERFRGINAEPAALASTCVTGIAYFGLYALQVNGWRRAGCLALVGAAMWMGTVSTSATFVVAGVVSAAVFVGVVMMRFAARRANATLSIGFVLCALIVAAGVFAPAVLGFVTSTVNDKLGSGSFGSRTSTDELSLGVFLDTFGFGVGLGSARASSFFPTLLSAVGLPGTLLLSAAIVTVATAARLQRECRPVAWALLAFLIVKLTSSPDLSGPDGTLWLSLGILSHAALHKRAERSPPPQRGQHAVTPDPVTPPAGVGAVTAGHPPAKGPVRRRGRSPRSPGT